jgi:hypothetical protein
LRKIRVLIDANLLLLLIVGSTLPRLIENREFKGLKEYGLADYDALLAFLRNASRLLVTPHILAETSNLLGGQNNPSTRLLYQAFRDFLNDVGVIEEIFVPSAEAANRPEFAWLGLTDAAALELSDCDITLLTADANLAIAAGKAGISTINFNHHRTGS